MYPGARCTTRGGTPPSRQTPATTPSWGGCRRPWRTATSCSCSTPTRGPAQVSTAHSAALSNTPDPGPGPTRRAVLDPVLAAAGDKLGVVVVTRRPEDTAGAVLSVFADPDTVITQVEEWSVDSRASKIGPHERRFVITQKAPTRALSWLKGSRHEIGIPASAQLSEGRRN